MQQSVFGLNKAKVLNLKPFELPEILNAFKMKLSLKRVFGFQ
jgi:hypothetical protein